MAMQVVGLTNLHSIGIMHRNVNPEDILFDASGHVVISNFECADMIGSSGHNTNSFVGAFSGYGGDGFMGHELRTGCYQAPEILLGWSHDCVVDCWGFGMVLYFMYFGKVSCLLHLYTAAMLTALGRVSASIQDRSWTRGE